MQALYAFFQHEKANAAQFEKDLFKSLDKIHELYFSILALLNDFHHVAMMVVDENKNKRLPGKDDLNPNMRFIENVFLVSLSNNEAFKKESDKRKISWQNDADVVRRLFNEIRGTELYKNYLINPSTSAKDDCEFLVTLITGFLSENAVLISLFEEKNIHWADDTFVAFNSVIRTIEEFSGEFKVQPLLKDEKDDLDFMSILFNKTIIYKEQNRELIDRHTKNWEIERIANMDMLLMEMAITEILHVPQVPIKASLNEYIDISKEYSTPNSKIFVNGVLDKIIAELRRDNKIIKTGRGLKES